MECSLFQQQKWTRNYHTQKNTLILVRCVRMQWQPVGYTTTVKIHNWFRENANLLRVKLHYLVNITTWNQKELTPQKEVTYILHVVTISVQNRISSSKNHWKNNPYRAQTQIEVHSCDVHPMRALYCSMISQTTASNHRLFSLHAKPCVQDHFLKQ